MILTDDFPRSGILLVSPFSSFLVSVQRFCTLINCALKTRAKKLYETFNSDKHIRDTMTFIVRLKWINNTSHLGRLSFFSNVARQITHLAFFYRTVRVPGAILLSNDYYVKVISVKVFSSVTRLSRPMTTQFTDFAIRTSRERFRKSYYIRARDV